MMTDRSSGRVLDTKTLEELTVDDESSFRHVGLYADLKQIVRKARLPFRILPADGVASWDRALLLNLTYWHPEGGGDVLVDETIPADVVAHVAWHHLAARALTKNGDAHPTVESLFMGEAIASAFDLYLVGRLLPHAPESSFLETQVPAMKEVAEAAGLSEGQFETLLENVADAPERAFADLRTLLFDACLALYVCRDADTALAALSRFDQHRLAPLLHRYELSNWLLYARAYAGATAEEDVRARAVDQELRREADPLAWLTKEWILPALG